MGLRFTSMKTTIELPDDLFIEAKKYAAEHRITIKRLVESGLRQQLGRLSPQPEAKRRRIKWVTVPGGLDIDISSRANMMDRLFSRSASAQRKQK